MANADFSHKTQAQAPGGFSAGSYREAPKADPAQKLTPAKQKLAAFEKKLPGALAKQATAMALCLAVMVASFVGFGGAKLKGKYNTASQ